MVSYMNRRICKSISVLLGIIFLSNLCGCSKKTETVNADSYWYGCSSFSVAPVDGYSQNVCATMYYDGYYYLTIFGSKIDEDTDGPENEDTDGPDSYYQLYKIDSEGNGIDVVSLPVECASYRDQVIVNDELYCIVPEKNKEYVIDINDGSIISEEPAVDTRGFYSINDGYVKITADSIIRYSNDGNETGHIDIGDIGNLNYSKPFYEKDGKYYLVEDNISRMDFYEVDFDGSRIDKVLENSEINNSFLDISGDLVFTDTGVYYIDFDDEALVPITEWNYVDVKPAYKTTISENNLSYGSGRFGKIYTYSDYEIELIIFNNISPDIYADRTPITVGGYDVESSLAVKWAVYEFNTSQDEYRVYLDEYRKEYPYTSGAEAQVQIAQLIQYFNDGNAPDIYFGTNFDYRYMYNAGLVANMMPLMDNDPDFNVDDLLPSIRDTIIQDDVCYQIFPAFIFNGDFGLRSVFGDDEYTYKMIDDLSQETGVSIRGDMQSAEFADQIIRYSLGELVDRSSGGHIASVEELEDIVDYSIRNGIPCNTYENYIADMDTVRNGSYLTCRSFLRNIYELSYYESRLNDSFVYLGFPSVYGSAHAADPDGLVAISSDTPYQDACWQFIKYMLSDEVQQIEIGQGQNPVISSVLDDYCQYATNPASVPVDEIIWNSIVNGREAVPEWIVSDYRSMVYSIDSVISYDWGVYNIICDEINSYDLQGKTIEAIAESLQSRLDIYVSENYK